MATAATAPSAALSTRAGAFVFAGGLAIGLGSAYALSRGSLAPATKVRKATRGKLAKAQRSKSAGAASGDEQSDAEDEDTPLADVLDAVDAKGSGPAAPVEAGAAQREAASVLGASSPAHKADDKNVRIGATGFPQPAPAPFAPAQHADAKINLAEQAAPALAATAGASAPAWLTGVPYASSTPRNTANGLLEAAVYGASDAVFVYESAAAAGKLGSWIEAQAAEARAKGWPAGKGSSRPSVFSMQTRAGATAAVLGYLRGSAAQSSAAAQDGATVSVLLDSAGLLAAAPALALAPEDTADRIVLQVSSSKQAPLAPSLEAGSEDDDVHLAVTDDPAGVLAAADVLGANGAYSVVLSADAAEAVAVARAAYVAGRGHVVHVFDGALAGREVSAALEGAAARLGAGAGAGADAGAEEEKAKNKDKGIIEVLEQLAELGVINYAGPDAPTALLVLPNTSAAASARAAWAALPKSQADAVGVLAVRVVRPWDEAALRAAIPDSVRAIHVLEEAHAGASAAGSLFEDVAATVFAGKGAAADITVRPLAKPAAQRVTANQWFALFRAIIANSKAAPAGKGAGAHRAAAIKWGDIEAAASAAAAAATGGALANTDLLTGYAGAPRLAAAFDTDASATSYAGALVARVFNDRSDAQSAPLECTALARFDNFRAGGLVRTDLLLGPRAGASAGAGDKKDKKDVKLPPVELVADQGAATLVLGDAANVLKAVDVFANAKRGAAVLVDSPGWTAEELEAKLRAEDRRTLALRGARLYLVDTAAVLQQLQAAAEKAAGGKAKAVALDRELAAVVLAVAFLRVHFGASGSTLVGLTQKVLGTAPLAAVGGLEALVAATERGVQLFNFDTAAWAAAKYEEDGSGAPAPRVSDVAFNAFARGLPAEVLAQEPQPAKGTWTLAAWQTLFPEAYGLEDKALRPDLHEKTWVVEVTENRRLTPLDYDRNVFHMELSTEGTDLKYEVGEALGIHGWNDEQEVLDFIKWSGYHPDEVVAVASATDPNKYETRTVFQVCQQKLDIFGKPGKKFYEALSKIATNRDEARWLRFISSAEGSSTFKKLSEIETLTYADVLKMFPSARLPFETLMTEVEEIKPRHYSIASAQAAVGNSVHLLIVTVDWKTPSGSPRYGQCTRYLANLRPGAKVTVSLKPSVMKLPPNDEQPIIMAGLGTGAAPFRAFIQARALQRAQGKKVGPLVYYFGSRYRASEYLYGEELEAYQQDGVVSRLGLAFSRDQKHKIYIQDRMKEDGDMLSSYLAPELDALRKAGGEAHIVMDDLTRNVDPKHPSAGYFYLCGPTWPVPDATEAILSSFRARGLSQEQAEQRLEKLKEEERFVLEVY